MPDENTSGLNSSVCAVLRQKKKKKKCWKGDGKKWLCFICEIFCSDPSGRHWTPLPRQLSLSLEPVIIFMQAEQSLCCVEPLSLHVHISIEQPGFNPYFCFPLGFCSYISTSGFFKNLILLSDTLMQMKISTTCNRTAENRTFP